jgi:diaminopimelate decarboxylase
VTAADRLKQIARQVLSPMVVAVRPRRRDLAPERWGLTVCTSGSLALRDVVLHELTATFGSPLHVVDGERLRATTERVVALCGSGTVFASARLTGVGAVLAELNRCGAGVIACSEGELEASLAAGVPAVDLAFAEAAPTDASLTAAVLAGAGTIFLSSAQAVDRLLAVAGDQRPTVGISVEVGDASDSSASIGGFRVGDVELHASIERLIASGQVDAAALRVVVVRSVRTDSDADAVVSATVAAHAAITGATAWAPTRILVAVDVECATTGPIGAFEGRLNRAFGADLSSPRAEPSLELTSAVGTIMSALATRLPASISVSIEPGVALTASTQLLLTTVLDVKEDGDPVHVVLDAGMNLAARTAHEYHQLFNASRHGAPGRTSYRMVGPVCTPADVLYTNWRLPSVQVRDVLAIMDVGAGFVSTSTSFSFPQPAVVMHRNGQFDVVRRAETFDDLVALDHFSPG